VQNGQKVYRDIFAVLLMGLELREKYLDMRIEKLPVDELFSKSWLL
jgi:hypothetical protein